MQNICAGPMKTYELQVANLQVGEVIYSSNLVVGVCLHWVLHYEALVLLHHPFYSQYHIIPLP